MCHFYSDTGVIVQPQHVAIPMIAVNDEGNPVISFFVQLDSTTFVSKSVIMMAVQVR